MKFENIVFAMALLLFLSASPYAWGVNATTNQTNTTWTNASNTTNTTSPVFSGALKFNASWGYDSFTYRLPVIINSTVFVNSSVAVTIDTASLIKEGKLNPDCSDIRVAGEDGTSPLNFWFDRNSCNSTSTVIWIRMTAPPGQSIAYIYYGNKNATNMANGESTFILFDDFKGNSIDSAKWNMGYGWQPGPQYQLSNGALRIYSTYGWRVMRSRMEFPSSEGFEVYSRQKLHGKDRWQYFSAFATSRWPWDSNRAGLGEDGSYGWGRNTLDFIYRVDGGAYSRSPMGISSNVGNMWFVSALRRDAPTTIKASVFDIKWHKTAEKVISKQGWSNEKFWWTSWVQDPDGTSIDYVFVRKAINPEPVAIVTEEQHI